MQIGRRRSGRAARDEAAHFGRLRRARAQKHRRRLEDLGAAQVVVLLAQPLDLLAFLTGRQIPAAGPDRHPTWRRCRRSVSGGRPRSARNVRDRPARLDHYPSAATRAAQAGTSLDGASMDPRLPLGDHPAIEVSVTASLVWAFAATAGAAQDRSVTELQPRERRRRHAVDRDRARRARRRVERRASLPARGLPRQLRSGRTPSPTARQ